MVEPGWDRIPYGAQNRTHPFGIFGGVFQGSGGMVAIGVVGILIDVALRRVQQVIETRRGL